MEKGRVFVYIFIISTIIVVSSFLILDFIADKYDGDHIFSDSFPTELSGEFDDESEKIERIVKMAIIDDNYKLLIDSLNILKIENFNNILCFLEKNDSTKAYQQSQKRKYFTEFLYLKNKKILDEYNPDILKYFYDFGNALIIASKFDLKNEKFKKRVGNFWLDKVSERLTKELRIDDNLKSNFKFKFLTSSLAYHKMFSTVKDSDFEKVILKISEKKWVYLYNRFSESTTFGFKTFFFSSLLCLILLFLFLLKYYLKKTIHENL